MSRGWKSFYNLCSLVPYSPQNPINLCDNISQFVIGVRRWEFQLQHQSINLIDADRDSELFLYGVFDETLRVQHDALRSIHEDHYTVAETE